MPKTPREKFSENLRRAREKRGISQEEVARLTEMHRTEISLLERGKREPRLSTLTKLSAVLEVPIEAFFEGVTWTPLVPGHPTKGRFVVASPHDDQALSTPGVPQPEE